MIFDPNYKGGHTWEIPAYRDQYELAYIGRCSNGFNLLEELYAFKVKTVFNGNIEVMLFLKNGSKFGSINTKIINKPKTIEGWAYVGDDPMRLPNFTTLPHTAQKWLEIMKVGDTIIKQSRELSE